MLDDGGMDFTPSSVGKRLHERMVQFMDDMVVPSLPDWRRFEDAGAYPLDVLEPLKDSAKQLGLWNLFLTSLKEGQPGTGLRQVDYAPLAETMGRVPWSAEVFNCSAPDSGNMELLQLFATREQARQWLDPLLSGYIRSCFAMSEPDIASSDPTQLQLSVRREGSQLVLNGRKWFVTGAAHPRCALAVTVAREEGRNDPHRSHSIVLVPMNTAGLTVERNIPVMDHQALDGHCELVFRDVRVPSSAMLGESGMGFQMTQARLGPGRVHHAMRSIGQCELALELMCERASERRAFGAKLADLANVQEWIAFSRVEIDQARLLVLRTAWRIDHEGTEAVRADAAAIKLVTAQLQTHVMDRAMQVFGAMGLSPDTPLARMWAWGRALRFLDGPDEVHLRTVARHELKRSAQLRGKNALFLRHWMPSDRC